MGRPPQGGQPIECKEPERLILADCYRSGPIDRTDGTVARVTLYHASGNPDVHES